VATSRRLDVRVGGAGDALDRFEAAWNRVAEGRAAPQLAVLSFADLPLLLKTLTPARWAILQSLGEKATASIYELAKRLGRDYKNVHTDVSALVSLGLIAKDEKGLTVPWQAVRAELRVRES
jgi:predicted transcriptional regulator